MYTGIHKTFNPIKAEKLVGSFPDFGVGIGVRKIAKLIDSIDKDELTFEDIETLNGLDYHSVEGWDKKTYDKFSNKFNKFLCYFKKIKHMVTLEISEKVKDGKMFGERICFTGFRDKTLEEIITNNGGEMVSGVSKKTTLVVAQDDESSSGKTDKARDLGIRMMSKTEFETFINKTEEEDKLEKKSESEFFDF